MLWAPATEWNYPADVDEAAERYAFAEMYIGADLQSLSTFDGSGGPTTTVPRLWIGGSHFWGHADFYVAFRLGPNLGSDDAECCTSLGIETGGKFFPWASRPGTVRPWIGAAWGPVSYERDSGPGITRHTVHATGGVAGRIGAHAIELGVGWLPSAAGDYAVSPTETVPLDLSSFSASARYKFHFDTTAAIVSEVASDRLAADLARLESAGALSSWYVSGGGTSTIALGGTAAGAPEFDFVGRAPSSIGIEVAAGWYDHDWDAGAQISWRPMSTSTVAYGAGRRWDRDAYTVEAYSFLGDYQGFAPFVGLGLGFNDLSFFEQDENGDQTRAFSGWQTRPELLFGWDIRPTRLTSWILRTALRVSPFLELEDGDNRASFRHLEFNFIQLVIYPARLFS